MRVCVVHGYASSVAFLCALFIVAFCVLYTHVCTCVVHTLHRVWMCSLCCIWYALVHSV